MYRLSALALIAVLVFSFIVPVRPVAAETYRGVEFPEGAISFADAVVSYQPATDVTLQPAVMIPANTLGPPDHITGGTPRFVSLGNGGRITLQFVDNVLTRSGTTAKDLWIFEIGPAVEDTDVAISQDGVAWIPVGRVAGSTAGIDIDAFVSDPAATFSYVRLTDVRSLDFDNGNTAGADIDAVGAISTLSVDIVPPEVSVPDDQVVEATGPDGAEVSFTASATDDIDGPLSPACDPPSGATFALGSSTVTCTATDATGNTGSAAFDVTVQDTTPPDLILPEDIEEEATGPNGADVSYDTSATDIVDGDVDVACEPPSGAAFPLGSTDVDCTSEDAAGNTGTGTFSVTVVDTTAPIIDGHDDITVEATGPDGASVTYEPPASHDVVDGDGIASCTPASGSLFALGTTAVICDAIDGNGNAAEPVSFTVSVVDLTAPVISGLPGDLTVTANGAGGAVVTWPPPVAMDAVDGPVEVICAPPSGATFPDGSTLVQCTATDTSGNSSSASFIVTTVFGVCPQFDQSKSIKAGAVKPIKVQLCAADGTNLSGPGLVLNAVGLQMVDGSAATQVEDPGNSNSPDSNFRFSGDGYVFNLATAGLATGTWELLFTINGGSQVYSVRFDIR